MTKLKKSVWFDGSNQIDCDIQKVKKSLAEIGKHFVGVVSLMPGISNVVLDKEGKDFVIIKNNEGLMKRTNIVKSVQTDKFVIEFDEEYQAGKKMNGKSHYFCEFSSKGKVVNFHLIISNVQFPGFLGFLYRNFGSRSIGNATLRSYKTYFEK
ncbi:MAG: hypothetical protein K9N07_07475 [Candidatus Cloacimonetes bacterium]|nr:hypothetical protein [Candidatus Cloacimonadota bacterium]MCF7866665.1 hypothetical protein [Candidatus Woesearchaeota archaeon]MCF8012834.1 hypothetical protein [Candidatus Woesearchaeota archaeon]